MRSWAGLRQSIAIVADLVRRDAKHPHQGMGRENAQLGLALEDNLIHVCRQIQDWAKEHGMKSLQKRFSLTSAQIRKMEDYELLQHAEEALQAIRSSRPELKHMKSDKVSTFTDLQVAFALNIGALRFAVADQTPTKKHLDKTATAVQEQLDEIDLYVSFYEESEPSFFQEYKGISGTSPVSSRPSSRSMESKPEEVTLSS